MDTFLAVADPTRRQLILTLAQGEHSFGDLASQFDMSRPAVSQHLKVLRESGIVSVRPLAQRRMYTLKEGALSELDGWLDRVRQFWNGRLDQLEAALLEEINDE